MPHLTHTPDVPQNITPDTSHLHVPPLARMPPLFPALTNALPRPCPTPLPPLNRPHHQAYEKLCGKLRELNALEGISGLLGWDEMVGGGGQYRRLSASWGWRAQLATAACLRQWRAVGP